MHDADVVKIAICMVYYHMGGLATTNIERLCSGATLPVVDSKCICSDCGKKINWFFQLPILSYVLCKGKCRSCSCKLPIRSLILEIIVFASMTLISIICDFSHKGILMSFFCYEFIKIFWVVLYGRRNNNFLKEYIISVLFVGFFLLLTEFMALILMSIVTIDLT